MNLGNIGRHTFAAPIAAFTLVAGGGIALAASGGGNPAPGDGPAPQVVAHRTVPTGTPTPHAHPTNKPTDDTDESTDASPSPSLTGLCKAYRAGGYASSTKNGHVNPAWSALERAAGGASDVGSYCDDRLAADEAAKARGADDSDEVKPGKPANAHKPAKAHAPDADDESDEVGDVDSDDRGDVDSDDVESDGGGNGGSHGAGHGNH